MGNCVNAKNKNNTLKSGITNSVTQRAETFMSSKTSLKKNSFTNSFKSFLGIKSGKVENDDTNDGDSLQNAIVIISSNQNGFQEIEGKRIDNARSLSNYPVRVNKSQKCSYKEDNQFMRGNPIGRGLNGIVYNCLDADNGEIMALKIYPHNNTPTIQNDIKTFKEIFFKLNDQRNIIKYLEFYNEDNCNSIIHLATEILMEMVSGGSFKRVIQNFGKLEEPIVSFFTKQILEALVHIYTLGITHRNIRLSNVLTESDGTVKLTDIWLFPFLQDDKEDYVSDNLKSKSVQFEDYNQLEFENIFFSIAPEVHVPPFKYTDKSDIWSLGCIVLELITGEPLSNVISPILENDFTLFEGLSEACKTFLKLCLNTDPNNRASANTLLESSFILDYNHDEKEGKIYSELDDNSQLKGSKSFSNETFGAKNSSIFVNNNIKSLNKINTINSEDKKDEVLDSEYLEEQRRIWEEKLLEEIGEWKNLKKKIKGEAGVEALKKSDINSEEKNQQDEDELIKNLMGFSSFATTKNQKHEIMAEETVYKAKKEKRKYRQYMNRKGGLNFPLDNPK